MKNNDKEAEQRLLKTASLDELIKMKMEEELQIEIDKSKEKLEKQVVTDISKVPTHLIFSKQAVYRIFNRVSKVETFINGLQAEAMLGLQTLIRGKIKSGEMDAFSTDTAYVKFEKVEC